MNVLAEIIKLIFLTVIIVLISKYVLVLYLRKFAETLNLRPRTVGNIAGFATSTPELLTVSFSAATGLISTGIYNILMSNIVSLILYSLSIIINKNIVLLKNKAIITDIILAIIAIIIPIILITINVQFNIILVPIFILLYFLFYRIDLNAHKLFLKNGYNEIYEKISEETKFMKGKKEKTIRYSIILVIAAICLFFVGNKLGEVLDNLCIQFGMPELFLGALLGFATSIPELITFFEAQKYHKKGENTELGVIEATNNLLSANLTCLFIVQSVGIIIFNIFN